MASDHYDVFISYKSEDLAFAQILYERLCSEGFMVWFDRIRLNPGFRWHDAIEQACENSRIVLPVLTPRWQLSEWTRFETYGAEAVIPILIEGAWEEVIPPPLHRYQVSIVDLTSNGESGWSRLCRSIRDHLGRRPPRKADRLVNLKYRAIPNFVGREKDLIRINEALHGKPKASLTQGGVYAITAIGGIGKTTLARQYAEKFWRLYPQIFWVDAKDDPGAGFAAIALILFPNLADQPRDVLARRALQAICDRTERLLILDDVEDEISIQNWIPKSGGCHTIITSRFAAWSTVENSPVYLLDVAPSRELLLKRAGRPDTKENNEACDRLAKKLEYLPLALEQAAAFINQEGPGFSFDDYLVIYEKSTKALLARKVLGSTQYPDSVMTTWNATLAKLSWNARALLRLSAFLSSKPIPKLLFIEGADTVYKLASDLSPGKADVYCLGDSGESEAFTIRDAIQELSRYSMVTNQGQAFSVHSLVQTVQQLETPAADCCGIIMDCIRMVRGGRPSSLANAALWNDWGDWLPHAVAVIDWAEKHSMQPGVLELYSWAGAWYEHIADYSAAEAMLRRIVDLGRAEYGAEALQLALHLNNLAGLLRVTNRLREAEEHFIHARDIIEAADESSQSLLGAVLNNLGLVYKATGRLQEAESLFNSALMLAKEDSKAVLRFQAAVLSNLASVFLETNRNALAEDYFNRALNLDIDCFGKEHPVVAKTLLNLAELYIATNRLSEAELNCRNALAITEQAFGKDHPETALCLNELARIYQETGRYSEAEPLFTRALEVDQVAFGREHERVAVRLNNLAGLFKEAGRLQEAEELMRSSLQIREKILGCDNPLTFHIYNRLAGVLLRMGKLNEADELARSSVRGWLNSETPRAFKSGRAHRTLALVLSETGQVPEAREIAKAAVSIYEETLAADDPRLVAIREEFTSLLN